MISRNRIVQCVLAALTGTSLFADSGTWTHSAGGNWSDAGNWQDGIVALNSGSTASFNAGAGTVTNDMADPALALLGLQFVGGAYTLAGSAISLDSAGFIKTLSGDHEVQSPLTLSGQTWLTAVTNRTLTVSGAVSGGGGIVVNGGCVVLSNPANSYSGQTMFQTGLLEVASIDALGDGTAPLLLGRGTFRFAGAAPGDLAQGYVVSNGGGNASTVLDARTNLTVSGKVDAPSTGGGRFIKTGPGTVTYTYPGYQVMNRNGSGVITDANLVFDTLNGGAGVQGYHDFTVAEGKVVFNAPGQTNRFISGVTIGERYAAAAHMEIGAGVVQVPDTWFSISRGNGDTNTPYASSLTVTGGRLESKGIVMGYGASMPNYKCYPVLNQSGGEIVIAGDSYIGETASANPTVNMTGGRLTCDGAGSGFALNAWNSGSLYATLNMSGSAEAYFAKLAVRSGAVLSVSNGATLGVRSTETANPGTVYFNNATLTTYAPLNQPSEWFHNAGKVYIGAGGLTANVPAGQYAYLGTPPVTNPGSSGGTVTKTGAGTLALYNTEIPLAVSAGRLKLMGGHLTTNKVAKTIALASSSELELAVPHAAEADTLSLAGPNQFELSVPSLGARSEMWKMNGEAICRSDGILQLVYPAGNKLGTAFMIRPMSVTNAWQASFSLAALAGRTLGNQGDGVCFVVQNDARGTSALTTTNYSGFGYASPLFQITNSFAVALDLTNRRLRFGTNGVLAAQIYDLSFLPGLGADSDKTYFSVSYDGAGTVSCSLSRKGMQTQAYTFPADLPALVRGTQAYVGFTAANASRYEQHLVGDIALSTIVSGKSYGQYGGKLALSEGQTLGVRLNPAPGQNGFGLGELTYANGSVLDVRQSDFAGAPAPTLADQGMWKLNGYANWKTDGRLAVSTNRNSSSGTAFTTNAYAIAGSWTARFGYDMGLHSEPPADYVHFVVQNSSPSSTSHTPSPGFAIQWRYYMGGTNSTMVRMYTNGIETLGSTNIAPVSLVNLQHATMTVSYDAAAKTVTVITEQAAGAYTNVFSGVNMGAVVGSSTAYLGFAAATGGLNAENIVSDFSFEAASGGSADTSWKRGYLGFGSVSGSGTLVKKGNAALGIQDGPGNPFTNATVRLDEGGLVLRKLVCEPVTLGDDFFLSPKASWAPGGALQTMPAFTSQAGVGATAKRHAVSQAWTARFTFFMAARSGTPADGFSFFLHNDVRGPAAVGGIASGSGYEGIGNSVGIRWNFYRNSMSNTVEYGQNGAFLSATRTSHMPIVLATLNAETDMLVRHDPAAKTLAVTMSQGTNSFSTTFTGVDIPAKAGDNLAYIGFGGGSGGEYCEARVKDFRFELDAPTNPLPVVACLGTAVLPDATTNTVTLDTVVSSASFAIASAQVGSGAGLALETANANGGTLAVANVALSGDAAFEVRSGATLALSNVTGGAKVTKAGAGTLALTGAVTYTGATVLSAGTLALASAVLPTATDLYVTGGATLSMPFDGKQYIHALFVNGVAMPGGIYTSANTAWITGPGRLVVTYPPIGTLFLLK